MKLSMMTLGCPNWDLPTLVSRAREYGFHAVDFRGIREALDITTLPAFTRELATTRRMIADQGLQVSGISSSLKVCDPALRQRNLEEARRTIPVALGLGASMVRVFGGGPVPEVGHVRAAQTGLACMQEILALDGARQLRWVFETHDHWIRGEHCRLLLDGIPDPAFGCLWDTGHTYRVEKEAPPTTWDQIGSRVHYVHIKDAVYEPGQPGSGADGWRYVPPGTGVLPLETCVRILQQHGYEGYLVFEHEKRWHPDLPEPEEIFPKFIAWARSLGVVS